MEEARLGQVKTKVVGSTRVVFIPVLYFRCETIGEGDPANGLVRQEAGDCIERPG